VHCFPKPYLYLFEINLLLYIAVYPGDLRVVWISYLIVLGYASPTVEPPDTAVDINHKTQPSAIWDEEGGGGAIRSIMEEFLFFELRFAGLWGSFLSTYSHVPSRSGQRDSVNQRS